MVRVVVSDPPTFHTGQYVVVALPEEVDTTGSEGACRHRPAVLVVAPLEEAQAGETAARRRFGSHR
jgi:hypothetical protein